MNGTCTDTKCEHEDGSPCRCAAERLLRQAAVVESDYLFVGHHEVEIRHAGEVYRLRVTRNGKLILNK
jgi:hemin uptake protein HemP